jgi:hypothetical protein
MVYGGAAARRRATINDTPEGMRITVPAQRSWWPLVFLPFWLTLWTFGGFAAIGALIFGGGSWFLGLWLLGWAAGWVMAFSWWWWMLTGREIITIDGVRLKHAWKARGYQRVSFQDLGSAGSLRFSPPVYGMSNQNWRQLFQQWASAAAASRSTTSVARRIVLASQWKRLRRRRSSRRSGRATGSPTRPDDDSSSSRALC